MAADCFSLLRSGQAAALAMTSKMRIADSIPRGPDAVRIGIIALFALVGGAFLLIYLLTQ
jgi:hypothetical protein